MSQDENITTTTKQAITDALTDSTILSNIAGEITDKLKNLDAEPAPSKINDSVKAVITTVLKDDSFVTKWAKSVAYAVVDIVENTAKQPRGQNSQTRGEKYETWTRSSNVY